MTEKLTEYLIIIGIIAFFLLLHFIYCRATLSNETITVSDKGIVMNNVSSDKYNSTTSHYMVYTKNGQALKNTNNLWFWKWTSDELQGKLKKGKKYKIKTWGIRVPFLGWYKHILSATEIKQKNKSK